VTAAIIAALARPVLAQPDGSVDAGADALDSAADAGQPLLWLATDAIPTQADGGIQPDSLQGIESGVAQVDSQAEEGQQAFLQASINQISIGDVLVVVRPSDLLMRVADLETGGVHIQDGKREMRGPDLLVSLRSLSPKISYVFDEASLSLTITADPSLFGASVVDLRPKRPEGILYDTSPSMFVNYSLSGNDLQSPEKNASWNGFAEAGLSVRGELLYSSGQRLSNDTWARLMTNLTFDWRNRLTRIIAGDSIATSDALGGSLAMGGLSVTRTFALDPYFVMLPSRQLGGTLLTPSTVEVYVNGQLVRREALPPGQFSLQNVPLTTGSGVTRVVIRDAFGGEQTMASPYYLALGTLAKGLSDFSYNFGFRRNNFGIESWNYGEPSLLFRHRIGVTNWLTLGGRIEGTPHMISGGPSAAARLPVGELAALVAVSGTMEPWTTLETASDPGGGLLLRTQRGSPGAAALLSYSYLGRPVNLQLGVGVQSERYVNLSLPLESGGIRVDRKRLDLTVTAAKALGKVALVSLQYLGADWRDQGWTNTLMLAGNRTLTRRLYAFVNLTNTFARGKRVEFDTFAGLSYAFGDHSTASASRSDRWGGDGRSGTNHLDVQRSLPVGPGYGYRVVVESGDNDHEEALAQYQGAHGRIDADYRRDGWTGSDPGHATLTGMGGIVLIGRDIFFTRPLTDSYALIKVPGVAGVHGTISNQVVGTTSQNGNLLVPNLLSYYGNRIGIDDKDIPLDYNIGATEMTIAPPYRGGAVVSFPIRRVQSVSGIVLVEDQGKATVPSYGQITVEVEGKPVDSPLDEAGSFYLENVPPGSYAAEVEYATGVCSFRLAVVAGATALANVGTVRCIVPGKESQ
jgi:outer membrane usher protein